MWGKNLLRGFIAFLFIFPISALAALTYQPSNTTTSYSTLADAVAAMNAAVGLPNGSFYLDPPNQHPESVGSGIITYQADASTIKGFRYSEFALYYSQYKPV